MTKSKTILVGLTGSIGMGKSTTAKLFAKLGVPVFCADQTVHALLKPEGRAFAKVARAFPQALRRGKISRKKLGELIFNDTVARQKLESLLHPLVKKERLFFLRQARAASAPLVVFDIPLLFETGEDTKMDVTLCVSAKAALQRQRVLARPGMTKQKMNAIIKHQMPDQEKRRRADYVIYTDDGVPAARSRVCELYRALLKDQTDA